MKPLSLASSLCALALLVCSASAAVAAEPKSCHFKDEHQMGGAWRLADGKLASLLPAGTPGQWRITHFASGKSHRLHPTGGRNFESAADFDSPAPVALRYGVGLDSHGRAQTLTIRQSGQRPVVARKIQLREVTAAFSNGGTELSGKLTLPSSGKPPYKTVVFVHGSDPVASVDQEWLPHLLASKGIATLVFDKRGTGCSKGQYLQHFDVLANDVVAAVQWLKTRPEVDPARIGLAGFSQGGWVAPLAALKEASVSFVLVGYGLAMSMADEDRLEAPLKLQQAGADPAAVAEYEALNAVLHQTARDGFKDWRAFEGKLDEFRDRPWLGTAKGLQTWVGMTLQMGVAQAKVVAPSLFTHFMQPFYDPVPTLEALAIPMRWLVAESDIEAPPGPTIAVLERLRQQGKPVSTTVFAKSDHGMFEFELKDGKRVRTKYADRYFATLLAWIHDPK